jgi:hypothetical protein
MSERMFSGFERGPDFDRARTRVATRLQGITIDFATPCPAEGVVFNVAGDFLYLDLQSTDSVYVELNSDSPNISPAVELSPGTGVDALFSSIRVYWQATSGTALLVYATGDRIRPQSSATTIVGTTDVNLVSASGTAWNPSGFVLTALGYVDGTNPRSANTVPIWAVEGAPGTETFARDRDIFASREMGTPMDCTFFKSSTLLAANTPETVVAPAGNALGLITFEAGSLTGNRTGTAYAQLLAKTSAPVGITDGDAHLFPTSAVVSAGPIAVVTMGMERPHRSTAGKGLYFITNIADVDTPYRIAKYRVFT